VNIEQVTDFSCCLTYYIYIVGGGTIQILENIWLDSKSDEKLKCKVMSLKSLIQISRS